MSSSEGMNFIKMKIQEWEARVEANEKYTRTLENAFLEITKNKDDFLKDSLKELYETIKIQPESNERSLKSLVKLVDDSMDRYESAHKQNNVLQKRFNERTEFYENLIANERRNYNNVIDNLMTKVAKLEGRDDLGSQLMKLVSEREEAIKMKYAVTVTRDSDTETNQERAMFNNYCQIE